MAKSKNDSPAVDAYLATLSEVERNTLEALRQLINATVPESTERIFYGTSVIFALQRDLVGFVAHTKHLSFFTMSPELAREMKAEITQTHKVSGATIHFSADNPLPVTLVKQIIEARVAENAAKAEGKDK